MENVFGSIAMILAIAIAVIALPSQIKKNHQEKRCGLSFLMVALPLGVYVARAAYALSIGSWYILVPDSLGVVFSTILLLQFSAFNKKHPAARILAWWFCGKLEDRKMWMLFGFVFLAGWFSSPWSWIIIGLGASSFVPLLAVELYKEWTKKARW